MHYRRYNVGTIRCCVVRFTWITWTFMRYASSWSHCMCMSWPQEADGSVVVWRLDQTATKQVETTSTNKPGEKTTADSPAVFVVNQVPKSNQITSTVFSQHGNGNVKFHIKCKVSTYTMATVILPIGLCSGNSQIEMSVPQINSL